jgi:hypothetical protein
MAFAESADMSILQAFAAFYRLQNMATLKPPPGSAFNLSDGSTFQNEEVEVVVRNACKSFDDSSEAKLPKQGSETNKQHIDRLSALFLNRRDIAARSFVADLKQQWPVTKPTAPTATETYTYIDVSSAMRKMTAIFETNHPPARRKLLSSPTPTRGLCSSYFPYASTSLVQFRTLS